MDRVTLSDIAAKAGVSVATVSLALRGRGDISKKRALEIRDLAEAMGYRPNPLLASLASKRFSDAKSLEGTPLAIFEFPSVVGGEAHENDLYHAALMAEASRLGYAPTSYTFPRREKPSILYRQLYSRAAQGVVLVGTVDHGYFGDEFDWDTFSVVQCARFRNHRLMFHTVRPNIFQAVKLAFHQVRDRGYQRIGFAVGHHQEVLEDDEDRHGAVLAMEAEYLPKRDRLPAYVGPIDDRKALLAWYHKYKPDAVIGFSPGHYWFLREEGIDIPGTIGFASLHLLEHDMAISGLYQNTDLIAEQSIQFLDQLIRNHQRGNADVPMELLVPSRWNEGTTLNAVDGQPSA